MTDPLNTALNIASYLPIPLPSFGGSHKTSAPCRAHFRTEEEGERYDLAQHLADLIDQHDALADDPSAGAQLEQIDEEMADIVAQLQALDESAPAVAEHAGR